MAMATTRFWTQATTWNSWQAWWPFRIYYSVVNERDHYMNLCNKKDEDVNRSLHEHARLHFKIQELERENKRLAETVTVLTRQHV